MKKKFRIGRLVVILVLLYFIYVCVTQQQTMASYEKEANLYKENIEDAEKQRAKLENVKENIDSTEYIEDVAREKLGMYLPNERVYIDITN
ncbi:MAG: cell division protein FtsL [Clostridia bacterium]|nr:cell division protein FtsL [Clostridia bacterium]